MDGTFDITKAFYYTTSTTSRGGPINKMSNLEAELSELDIHVLKIDPNRIHAICFGFYTNDSDKDIFEARCSNEKHNTSRTQRSNIYLHINQHQYHHGLS